jgi:GMP synthase (glutamine-hydrolysing)
MRAVVFQHEEHEGLGMLGPVLEQAGFSLVKRFRSVRREDVDAELVVVMGGRMGVYEADQHPFLNEELALLSERLANERPCLGICLGAQLLAAAAGAEVFPGKNGFEVGAAPVRWTQEALKDPVIAGVRARTVVAHWHGDSYKAVQGATLLASTDRYTQQAFRFGSSYGFQFHPELGAEELGRWLDLEAEDLRARGKDPQELRAQLPKLKSSEPELTELLHRLANHFAKAVR